MTPHVSVVIPVRDGARWLGEAVESVLSQSLSAFELIVVDDGSADDTPRILEGYAGRDGRIRVLRQDPLGLVAALNRGLAEARGALLARLDADDRALPQRLERQARHLEAHPEIGLLGSWAREIDEAGRRRGRVRPPTQHDALAAILRRGNPFVHSSVMLRVEPVRRLGGFRPAFRAAEDYDLWLRLSEVAKIANLPQELVEYRWHGTNVTLRNAVRQAFSVRLAQRSARARRETGRDPADALAAPPDWRSPAAEGSFYESDAMLYRLLDLADPELAAAGVDFAPLAARFAELSRAERALAAQAMINHMTRAGRDEARRTRLLFLQLFLRLLCRHPGTMPRQAWRALPGALLR